MHFTSSVVALSLAALSVAQTPAGFTPRSDTPVGISFNGTTVNPNGELLPQSLTQTQPTIFSNGSYPGVYMLALVDLSIPYRVVATNDTSSLVPGDGPGRTTRLHWWLDGVTQAADGTFSGNNTLANYQGPQPPAGDIPHEYTLFLFNRPASFHTPPKGINYYFNAAFQNGDDRMNFSVPILAKEVGNPIASRYFTVQKANGTTTAGNSSTNSLTTGKPVPYTGAASTVGVTFPGLGLVALVSAFLL
ncbi:hypothetical protein MBLNU457_2330t1 [Dothideomycetes sp. NU457]